MSLKKCAICDEAAEFSDANETLELHSDRYKLVQCSNGSCKQAAWGDAYWNENQDFIAELKQDNEALRRNNSDLLDQRYELMQKIGRFEKALCETCGDPRCEDSVVEYLKQKVARLEGALRDIRGCSVEFVADPRFEIIVNWCNEALRGGE